MPETDMSDVLKALEIGPLKKEDFDRYYVETKEARGVDVARKLKKYFLRTKGRPKKVIFSGHRGSGKSTEIERLTRDIKDEFLVSTYSIEDNLDKSNVTHIDILFENVHTLCRDAIEKEDLKINEKIIEKFNEFMKEITVEKIDTSKLEASAGAEAGAGANAFLLNFMMKISSVLKSSHETREVVREKFDPRIEEFVTNANHLIIDIKNKLREKYDKERDILIVIDDLEKVTSFEKARELFRDYGGQLTRLDCHVLYTIPIELLFSEHRDAICGFFDQEVILPSIKIDERDGSPYRPGRDALKRIIEKRMELSLFEDGEETLNRIIENSGGSLRDMFRIIIESSLEADEKIRPEDVDKAILLLENKFSKAMVTRERDDMDFDTLIGKLKEVDESKDSIPDEVLVNLLYRGFVIEYNGEGWYGVHPMVKNAIIRKWPDKWKQ